VDVGTDRENGKRRAHVFDDDPLVLLMLRRLLEDRGYQVFCHAEADPLCRNAVCPKRETPEPACTDVIITDVHMAHSSGIDFVGNLRRKHCKAPKVAMMSGLWTNEARRWAERMGCKVFDKPVLAEHLDEWLRAHDAVRP
jgi:DNA-binding response OmpR family regulator